MSSSEDLTPFQLQELARQLGPKANYLSRPCERMQRKGWKQDDALYARALRARNGLMALVNALDEMQNDRDKPAWLRARGA
jgi:hypothetical protein